MKTEQKINQEISLNVSFVMYTYMHAVTANSSYYKHIINNINKFMLFTINLKLL